jgi:hypothetical protein
LEVLGFCFTVALVVLFAGVIILSRFYIDSFCSGVRFWCDVWGSWVLSRHSFTGVSFVRVCYVALFPTIGAGVSCSPVLDLVLCFSLVFGFCFDLSVVVFRFVVLKTGPFWRRRRWCWFCCVDDGFWHLLVSNLVCGCSGFGAAGVGVVVTDLWLQICVLVPRCACWCLVEEAVSIECECDGSEMRGAVVATDLKWCGGGCDGSNLEVAVAAAIVLGWVLWWLLRWI